MDYRKIIELEVPVRIISGIGSHKTIGEKVNSLGRKRALIVTDKGVVNAGKLQMIILRLEEAQIGYVVFDEILSDPPIENVEKAVQLVRKEDIDIIIAIGGGSPIDVAKATRVIATSGGSVMDWVGLRLEYPSPPLDLISIPTTAGTGAEVSSASVITNEEKRVKVVMKSPKIFSTIAILDSEMVAGINSKTAAYAGLDALSHAIENYVSRNKSFLTQGLALYALKVLFKNLPIFVSDTNDLEAGMEMLNGCCLAGIAMTIGGLGLAHAIGHPIGTHFKIPHGLACGICLPHVVEYNIPANPDAYGEMAVTANPSHIMNHHAVRDLAHKFVEDIERLMVDIGIPRNLGEAGYKIEISPAIVEEVATSFLAQVNARTVTKEKIGEILSKIK